jgi:hypothetical protein
MLFFYVIASSGEFRRLSSAFIACIKHVFGVCTVCEVYDHIFPFSRGLLSCTVALYEIKRNMISRNYNELT